jgi:hypothetical protein
LFEFERIVVRQAVSETHYQQYGFMVDGQCGQVVHEHLLSLGREVDF